MAISRRIALAAAAALALAGACADAGQARGKYEQAGDMAIGDPKAPVTLIEYASVTCGHCKSWHDTVYAPLKANYIDTGKVRFVFRELPTPPAAVASAGFQLARCGDASPEEYLNRISVLFEQQPQVFRALQQGAVAQQLSQIARSAGLSEEQFQACINDEAGYERIRETTKIANEKYDVTATPTLILNGTKLSSSETLPYEALAKRIDQALATN